MKICKNCKYWANGFNIKNGFADCGKIELKYNDTNEIAYIEVDVNDDSGLDVVFTTNENFGCMFHKEK